jgi:hypothetical protein
MIGAPNQLPGTITSAHSGGVMAEIDALGGAA